MPLSGLLKNASPVTDTELADHTDLQTARSEYMRCFGKPPAGPKKNDMEWLRGQIDNADDVKRIYELRVEYAAPSQPCAMHPRGKIADCAVRRIGQAKGSANAYNLSSKISQFMTYPQLIQYLEATLVEARGQRPATSPEPMPAGTKRKMDFDRIHIAPSPPRSPSPHRMKSPRYSPITPDATEDATEFAFETILEKKVIGDDVLYHVQWFDGTRTWEPVQSFPNAALLLKHDARLEAEALDCGWHVRIGTDGKRHCVGLQTLCARHRAVFEMIGDPGATPPPAPRASTTSTSTSTGASCSVSTNRATYDDSGSGVHRTGEVPAPMRMLRPLNLANERLGLSPDLLVQAFRNTFRVLTSDRTVPRPEGAQQERYMDAFIQRMQQYAEDAGAPPTPSLPQMTNDDDARFVQGLVDYMSWSRSIFQAAHERLYNAINNVLSQSVPLGRRSVAGLDAPKEPTTTSAGSSSSWVESPITSSSSSSSVNECNTSFILSSIHRPVHIDLFTIASHSHYLHAPCQMQECFARGRPFTASNRDNSARSFRGRQIR